MSNNASSLLLLLLLLAMVSVALLACPGPAGRGKDYEGTLHLQRLRQKLLCPYDVDAGPAAQPNAKVRVRVRFLRTRMDVDEETDSLKFYGYVMLVWRDEWLVWEPSQYGNVTRMYVDADEIWTPQIAMADAPTRALKGSQALVVNGSVVWTLLAPLRAPCIRDPTRWPYDKMVCNVTVINLSSVSAELDTSNGRDAIRLLHKFNYRGWSLMPNMMLRTYKKAAFEDGLIFEATVTRNADQHEVSVVLPCVAVSWLMLASLWLPADAPHRPLLLCSVVLTQVLLNVAVATRIHVVGVHPPGVLLLLRDALLLSGVALLQWLSSRWLLGRPPAQRPAWPLVYLADLADYASAPEGRLMSRVLVLPPMVSFASSEDAVVPSKRTASMAAITDRVTFIVMVVVLAALSARLVP